MEKDMENYIETGSTGCVGMATNILVLDSLDNCGKAYFKQTLKTC